MRKIEEELRDAINYQRPFSKGNTVFHKMVMSNANADMWELVLHGNHIATFDAASATYPIPKYVSFAGWPTKTTASRLNSLPSVCVNIRNGVPYLNGRKIDANGWWSPNNLNY